MAEGSPRGHGTVIRGCSCESAFQDASYGEGRRVTNNMVKDGKVVGWRCTVCGNVSRSGEK